MTDIGNKAAVGGMSREFYQRVGAKYGREIEWRFEPHVAEAVATTTEVPAGLIDETGLVGLGEGAPTAEMEQLVRNIQEHGLLQPVIVAPLANGQYRIVAGHKRYLACRWLGWKNIPVLVHLAPDARIPTA